MLYLYNWDTGLMHAHNHLLASVNELILTVYYLVQEILAIATQIKELLLFFISFVPQLCQVASVHTSCCMVPVDCSRCIYLSTWSSVLFQPTDRTSLTQLKPSAL